MIELLNILKQMKAEDVDKLVLSNYVLEQGLYVFIDETGNLIDNKVLFAQKPSKKNPIESMRDELYMEYSIFDFKCKILDSNKYFASKKFKGNNYYSLIINRSTLPDLYKEFDLGFEIFFEKLKEYIPNKQIYYDELNKNKNIFAKNIDIIINLCNEYKLKEIDNIKIFILTSLDKVDEASSFFEMEKLFVSKDAIEIVDDVCYGLPSISNTLNPEKPYLSMMSTSFKIPYTVDLKNAIMIKKLKKWIESQGYIFNLKENYYKDIMDQDTVNHKNILVKMKTNPANKKREIIDYRIINNESEKNIKFITYNIFTSKTIEDITVNGKEEEISKENLRKFIDRVYYKNTLLKYMYMQSYDDVVKLPAINQAVKSVYIDCAKDLLGYFEYNYHHNISNTIDKLTQSVIMNSVITCKDIKLERKGILEMIDARISLLNHFTNGGLKDMAKYSKETLSKLYEYIHLKDYSGEYELDSYMYNFLAGQIAYYLTSRTKGSFDFRLVDTFIKAKTPERLREECLRAYDKYGYDLKCYNLLPINKGLQLLVDHKIDKNIKFDSSAFINGFLSNNLFYKNSNNIKEETL